MKKITILIFVCFGVIGFGQNRFNEKNSTTEPNPLNITASAAENFPEPYCGPIEYEYAVEPITLVEVAGISNRSHAILNESPSHEDFTSIVGEMTEGETYPIALEGHTGGFITSFTVFVDWDQDGTLDNESERYEIGSISYSNGTDGQQATGNIVVPTGVSDGPTRMRVIKRFTSTGAEFATDSCTPGSNYGQAEDYTIVVSAATSGGNDCLYEHTMTGGPSGGQGSSQDSAFKSATDLLVAAGETFTLNEIVVPFLTFAPEDAPVSATVKYHTNVAGLPGVEIGSETVVPTILSSAPWDNPDINRFITKLELTPFTFEADLDSSTTFWIEISMGTAINQTTVYWEYTEGTGIVGEPMVVYSGYTGTWLIQEPLREGIYSFIGECSALNIYENTFDGFSYYPNPTSDKLSLNSMKNIESVAFYNMLGQKVMETKIGATSSDIELSNLSTGTYIMKVAIDSQIGTFKVLKK